MAPACVVAALLLSAAPAWAHGGGGSAADSAWAGWSWDPLVVLPLAVGGLAYGLGILRLWSAAGPGSGVQRWRAAAFAAGWLVLALALVTPLDRLGETYFSAHMVQHQALMLVAAPLLLLGSPAVTMLWSLPASWRRAAGGFARRPRLQRGWRMLARPLVAFSLYGLVLWAWHAPRLYEAALASYWLHVLQHATFLAAALLFWGSALERRGGVAGRGAAVLSVAATAVHSAILGALMTFATRPWYAHPAAQDGQFPLTPLEDQQLAGLIMWVPGGIVHLAAGVALAAMVLGEAETQSRRDQRRWPPPLNPAGLER